MSQAPVPRKLFYFLAAAFVSPTLAMIMSWRSADAATHAAETRAATADLRVTEASEQLAKLRASITCRADVDRRVAAAQIDFLIAIYDGRDASAERGTLERARNDRAAADSACGG